MTTQIKPIYLLADSELLFWKQGDSLFLDSIRKLLTTRHPKAAYIGASNGDIPDYFGIFEAAMAQIGIDDCRMIRSSYSEKDAWFLEQAEVILLAGGDIRTGWRAMEETGMKDAIVARYCAGAVLIGISAGSVQLGTHGFNDYGPSVREMFETMRLAPFMVDVHDERNNWSRLAENIERLEQDAIAIGIPRGCGLIVHPDGDLEPIRSTVDLFVVRDGRMGQSKLAPLRAMQDSRAALEAIPATEGLGKVSLKQFSGFSASEEGYRAGRCAQC